MGFRAKMSGETREKACCIEFVKEYILEYQGCTCGRERLRGGNGDEELPRSGERGVEAEKQARATQEASGEEGRLRGALGFVWLVL